ncbi:FtsW/RodA/SpoVE family cell cycle protein [Enemella sp. A6]|uniref:FtsW/RodA/SpoVE family cell cycle protein n=1 Tax=Enemella sp. A6 TaxID=3440152 RepID=UPI003EB8A5B4
MPDSVVVYRKRRNIELLMMVLAAALGLACYTVLYLNLTGAVPDNLPVVAAIWLAVPVVLNIIVRWRLPYADPVFLPVVIALHGFGLVMIHRIDLINEPATHDAEKQLLWAVLGVALFIAVLVFIRDHRPLQGFTYLLFLAGMGLMLLPLLPFIGSEIYGARIWIQVGPFSFQPAEVAKVVLTLAFAAYLNEKRDVLALAGKRILGIDLPRARDLGPILLMWAASLVVLVFQKDLGTSLLFFGLFVVMLYVSTERPGWAILGALLFIGGALAVYFMAQAGVDQFNHITRRFSSWLDPFSDFDGNRQVINAQFGLAWGGLLGAGLGMGRPGLTTFAKSDMIAAAIGEELGIIGLMAVIVLYGVIVARGLRTALASKDDFGKLLAAGLSFTFALQVFIIVGGVTRLLPLTGLTTPFMSQGGSSLIANWVIVALLMVISHHARKPVAVASSADLAGDTTQIVSRAAS